MNIAVDLDEVLADSLEAFLKYHNELYGTSFQRSGFFSYNFWEVMGGTKKETTEKVYDFYNSSYFDDIKLIPLAREILQKLKVDNSLYVITSRSDDFKEKTKEWVEKNFPGIFQEVLLTNDYSKSGVSRKKSELCDYYDINIMIEDSLDYAVECLAPGRKIILLRCPWNEDRDKPAGVYEAVDWNDVPKIISS